MKKRTGMTLAVATLLVACATSPLPKEAPNVIPRDVLNDFCSWLIAQYDLESEPEIIAWRETRSLIDVFLLHLLVADEVLTPEDADRDDQHSKELRNSFKPIPVIVPRHSSSCRWKERDVSRGREGMGLILSVSGPLKNPYPADREGEIGVFARLSYGPPGGNWYWIVLQRIDGEWRAGDVFPLDISEN